MEQAPLEVGVLSLRSLLPVRVFIHQRCENPDQFIAFSNHRILSAGQVTGLSKHAQAVARFFEFAETDLALRKLVAIARAVIRFFVVGTGGGPRCEHLIRKCRGDGPAAVQKFHHADDHASELKQTLA